MKKIVAIILTMVMLLSLTACKDNQSATPNYNNSVQNNNTTSIVTDSTSLSSDDLKDIVSILVNAEEYTDRMAALLVRNWTTDSYFVYFYDKYRFKNSSFEDDEDFADVHKYREKVESTLSEAKNQLETDGTSEFYNAVKDYYLSLNNYLKLLSEFPTGYSKLTYSTAISDCQNECRTNRTAVEFYIE